MTVAAGGARAPRRRFDPRLGEPTRVERIARRALLAFIGVNVVLALASGHRAIWQVQRLDVRASDSVLRPGVRLSARITSSARTFADVRLELVQGPHVELLGERVVPPNRDGALDPRSRQDSVVVVLGPELLARLSPGPVWVRATGLGRSQWLRVPPPVVRELQARIPPT